MTDYTDDIDEEGDPVLEVLTDLEHEDKLTAREVVDRAIDPDSPLHAEFEWDDAVAADEHRLTQARQLIARYKVVHEVPNGGDVTVRRFTHVRSAGVYQETRRALGDPLVSDEVMARARRELASWHRRFRHLGEFRNVVVSEVLDGDA